MESILGMTEIAGYLAAALVFATFYMKTMIPLRVIGICSNCMFIIYGYLGHLYPVLILHVILLPLNGLRLREMVRLPEKVRSATQGDLNLDWLKPFTSVHRAKRGDVLFRKGGVADAMFFTVSGRYRLIELERDILPGHVVGELGLFAPDTTRTGTLECVEDGELWKINYAQVKQLYYQNPEFGFYFVQLITRRLFENIGRLENELAHVRRLAAPLSPSRDATSGTI